MRWFSGSRLPAEAAPARGHRSAALAAILGDLPSGSRQTVLDLGPPLADNVKLLSGLSCRVRVADLHRSLCAEDVESRRPEAMGALYDRLLPLAPDERFAALLAWDVFDYLRPDQVSSLMARLTPAFRPGALALVLVWTRPQVPARPLRYRIVGRESLAYEGPSQPVRPGPRYGQHDLARMMPGFSVQRSFLLRSGIQEFLLARHAVVGAARGQDASDVGSALAGRSWFRRGRL
ncbi:MAG TPA: hypothetical protein VL691_11110 [Vicinamibacteria bacterium]|nr:hypothetical protein [Vicinamibacteria bacterium]